MRPGNVSSAKSSAPLITRQIALDRLRQEVEAPLLGRDDLLPVPLVDVRAVVVVEEVVLAHGAHVRHEALAGLHSELRERDAFPLRGRLDDLRLDRVLSVVVRDVERDGAARPVAVEVVVHAALGVDDERDLDAHEAELAAEAVLDVPLDGRDRALRLFRVEERRVVVREDFLELRVVPDPRTREVGLLVERDGLLLENSGPVLHVHVLSPGSAGRTTHGRHADGRTPMRPAETLS